MCPQVSCTTTDYYRHQLFDLHVTQFNSSDCSVLLFTACVMLLIVFLPLLDSLTMSQSLLISGVVVTTSETTDLKLRPALCRPLIHRQCHSSTKLDVPLREPCFYRSAVGYRNIGPLGTVCLYWKQIHCSRTHCLLHAGEIKAEIYYI